MTTQHTALVSQFYDRLAATYSAPFRTPVRHWYWPLGGDLSGRRVLDAGCGAGVDAVAYADKAQEVVAVDISSGMVVAARARCQNVPNVQVVHGDAERVAAERAHFDVVFSVMEIFHHEDVAQAIRAYADSLIPDGVLVLVTNHPSRNALVRGDGNDAFIGWYDEVWPDSSVIRTWHQPEASYERQFADAGLRLTSTRTHGATDDVRLLWDWTIGSSDYSAFLALVGRKRSEG